MNMFLHELRMYRKSTIIWTVSIVALILMFMSIYPVFSNNAEDVKKLLMGFPEAARKALSISIDQITSYLGFYSYIFVYVTLCGSIQAMNTGISLLSKENNGKTVDFLLSKPVTRTRIITSKLLAAVTCLIITNLVYLVSAYAISIVVVDKPIDSKLFFMISITLIFVQIIFVSLGLIISVLTQKLKSITFASLGIVFGFFIIGMFGSVIGDTVSRYLTPFKYFNPSYIIANASYEFSFLITAIVIVIVSISASYVVYSKKDIHAV
ncbi:MAG: ABC transporter permease subunit [Clostridia bacterium]